MNSLPQRSASGTREPPKKPVLRMKHLEFGSLQSELIQLTEEVHRIHRRTMVDRLRGLFNEDEEVAPELQGHLSGRVLLVFQAGSQEANGWTEELMDAPAKTEPRLRLLMGALSSRHQGSLPDYRNLLLQACLPLYIGNITPKHLQLAAQAYRLYLKQVYHTGKRKLLTVRSKQLRAVNVDRVSMRDLIKSAQGMENTADAVVIRELDCALRMLDMSRHLIKLLKASFSIPLDLALLNRCEPKPPESEEFIGDILSSRLIPDKQALLSRKVMAVLEVFKEIPPLHSLALRISGRMQQIESKMPLPFVMEGRVRLEAVRLMFLRIRCGDTTLDDAIKPALLKMLESYYRALKRTSLRQPNRSDVPLLLEFAQVVIFTHRQRRVALIPHDQMIPLLNYAHKAMQGAVKVEPAHQRFADLLRDVRKRYGLHGK